MVLTSRPSNYNLRSVPETNQQQSEQPQQQNNQEEQVNLHQVQQQETRRNMSGVFKLDYFHGNGSQDIISYLKRFDQFCLCTGLKNEQAMATLAWHLEGNARLWFENLEEPPTNLDTLKTLLKTKYKKSVQVNLDVYSMRQSPHESVDTFLNRLEAETLRCSVPNNVQVQIALNGMDRSIGAAISTHAPSSLDEVRKLVGRMSHLTKPEVNAAQIPSKLETSVEVLTAAVAKLAANIDTPQEKRYERRSHQEPMCTRCGGRCYSLAHCRANGKTCFKCGKENHFGDFCRSSRNRQRGQSYGKRDFSQTKRDNSRSRLQ